MAGHPRDRAPARPLAAWGWRSPSGTAPRRAPTSPDFIVLVDDRQGDHDLLHLVVEIKGYRREDAKEKKATMESYWVPGVNRSGAYDRWAFAEFTDVYTLQDGFLRAVGTATHADRACSSVIVMRFRRIVERNISAQEIQQSGSRANIIEEYPDDKYSPSCLLLGFTSEGRPLHIQVSLAETELVKIITLYEPHASEWIDYTYRR